MSAFQIPHLGVAFFPVLFVAVANDVGEFRRTSHRKKAARTLPSVDTDTSLATFAL